VFTIATPLGRRSLPAAFLSPRHRSIELEKLAHANTWMSKPPPPASCTLAPAPSATDVRRPPVSARSTSSGTLAPARYAADTAADVRRPPDSARFSRVPCMADDVLLQSAIGISKTKKCQPAAPNSTTPPQPHPPTVDLPMTPAAVRQDTSLTTNTYTLLEECKGLVNSIDSDIDRQLKRLSSRSRNRSGAVVESELSSPDKASEEVRGDALTNGESSSAASSARSSSAPNRPCTRLPLRRSEIGTYACSGEQWA